MGVELTIRAGRGRAVRYAVQRLGVRSEVINNERCTTMTTASGDELGEEHRCPCSRHHVRTRCEHHRDHAWARSGTDLGTKSADALPHKATKVRSLMGEADGIRAINQVLERRAGGLKCHEVTSHSSSATVPHRRRSWTWLETCSGPRPAVRSRTSHGRGSNDDGSSLLAK